MEINFIDIYFVNNGNKAEIGERRNLILREHTKN